MTESEPIKTQYLHGESWDDFIDNKWPEERKSLYALSKIKPFEEPEPRHWETGKYEINLPPDTQDEYKEKEFRQIFTKDVGNVKKQLKSYTDWNIAKDLLKDGKANLNRAVSYPLAMFFSAFGRFPVNAAAFASINLMFIFEIHDFHTTKKQRDRLIKSLESLEEEENLKIQYYPETRYIEENHTIKTPIIL